MDSIIKTDVCIVGAGPSGASTSMMLSKHQVDHYIIDKATFPRDKTCGDGLILYAYKSLKTLGLLDEFLKNPKFIHSKKIRLHIHNQLNVKFQESIDREMIISYARRFDFDDFLVSHIDETYAHLELGNGVKTIKEESNLQLLMMRYG